MVELSGTYQIPAARDAVFTALQDPDVLRRCIEGCDQLTGTEPGVYDSPEKYCPTNVAFLPGGDLLVGDGYGSSYIHRYTAAGEFVKTIINPGGEAGKVSCPHGLWIDDRSGAPRLAVLDAVTMSLADYRRVAQPELAYFGRPV